MSHFIVKLTLYIKRKCTFKNNTLIKPVYTDFLQNHCNKHILHKLLRY
uniref:Uncharacterized protein n=1 Tax=Anguilla anguilla TaxID=7936 RepID=A0A0E9TQT0_ANGAN